LALHGLKELELGVSGLTRYSKQEVLELVGRWRAMGIKLIQD